MLAEGLFESVPRVYQVYCQVDGCSDEPVVVLGKDLFVAFLSQFHHRFIGGRVESIPYVYKREKPLSANDRLTGGPISLDLEIIINFPFDIQNLI